MKATKYHEMQTEELAGQLKDLKQKLFGLRFSHATGQLANPMEMAACKKDIARIKTILRERELKAPLKPAAAAPAKPVAAKAKAKAKQGE